MHSILEKYFKGELSIFELSEYYCDNYMNNVTESFPNHRYVDLGESYYNQGKEYLDDFSGLEQYEVLGVEEKLALNIGGYNFTGYIDLTVKNQDGDIEIIDHKSRDLKPRSTRKKPTKSDAELDEYLKQLYLYSLYTYQKYNIYPKYLNFNAFRHNIWIQEPFDINKLEESKTWLIDTIHNIENENEFAPKPDKFFCSCLCEYRSFCEPFR
jgi:hypothetical protein